jgi:hypothetical protein
VDLSNEEIKAIRAQNQRLKALGTGQVTILWKDGKIEKIFVNAEVSTNIYESQGGRVELKEVDKIPDS